jgi:N-acetylglucosamine-6-phosphate deacetylase
MVPAYVDIHCHGGGGTAFTDLRDDAAAAAAEHHHSHGSTSLLASLVTMSPRDLERGVAMLAELADDGVVDGIHLEGPWISAARCGAHDPALLRDPDLAEVDRLLRLGRGHIRQVTLAPERSGGLDLVRHLAAAGVRAAVGHSSAPYGLVLDAIDAGADLATHLFNGMDPWHHREPGAVPALLRAAREGRVTLEVIADGVHVADDTVRTVVELVGAEQVAFVSDAMGAAGMGDGRYVLGGLAVLVADGVARLEPGPDGGGPGSLAGGTSHGIDIVLRQVRAGIGLARAVQSGCVTPARFLGLPDRGTIAPGARADLVAVDEAGQVQRVMRAGRWLTD